MCKATYVPNVRKGAHKVLAGNLRAERARRQWSQVDLAEKTGLSRVYVGQIERGQANVSLEVLERLADSLDLSIAALLTEP